jgi:hypothetical protein
MADYVVEQDIENLNSDVPTNPYVRGLTKTWYRKWNSGLLEQGGLIVFLVPEWYTDAWPLPFVGRPQITSCQIMMDRSRFAPGTIGFALLNGTNFECSVYERAAIVSFEAKGRWK